MVLFANTEPEKGSRGITAFLIPTDTPGLKIGPPDDKLGIRGAPSAQVFLTDCTLGDDARLGAEGEGFKIAMRALDGGRIGIGAQAVGIARAAFEDATEYALARKTFGQPIAEHQAIQFKLADMCTEIEAARALLWRAAVTKDHGGRYAVEASMAKLFASEVANRVAKEGVQIFGGYGYLSDFPAERHFRDAKITEIYEGTSEIQRLVIASALLKEHS
jgi:butyryl-CoA dehydrogenase